MSLSTLKTAAILACLSTPALAVPTQTPFTWTPGAIGLNGGQIVNATGYNVADYATINVDPNTGNFTETGVLKILTPFTAADGSNVASTGLNDTYGLYFMFSATGNQGGPIPTAANSTVTGQFNTLTFSLYADPSGNPSVSSSNGVITVGNSANAFVIATGDLYSTVGNSVSLTNTGNGYSPSANLYSTFNPCLSAGQGSASTGTCGSNTSAFFTAPIGVMQFAIGNFSASTSRTTVTGNRVDIIAGGGNVTQLDQAVPEPASMLILGGGLAVAGLARRRKLV